MGLPGLDVVLGLATGAVDVLVNRAAAHTIETGDDEACVDALRSGLDAGDDALDAVPACGAIVEFLEPAQLLAASVGRFRQGSRQSPLAGQSCLGYSAGPSWQGGLGWGALGAGRRR